MNKVAKKCYLPHEPAFVGAHPKYQGKFKVCFSLSGTILDQMEAYTPDGGFCTSSSGVGGYRTCGICSMKPMPIPCVHLRANLNSETWCKLHQEKIKHHFNGYEPKVFRNTELIYSDQYWRNGSRMGFEGILSEPGAKHILGWKSPNFVYVNAHEPKLKVLLKKFRLSDDIAFRFGEKTWSDYPLTTDKFINWLNQVASGR